MKNVVSRVNKYFYGTSFYILSFVNDLKIA